jgi:hypothetical protein
MPQQQRSRIAPGSASLTTLPASLAVAVSLLILVACSGARDHASHDLAPPHRAAALASTSPPASAAPPAAPAPASSVEPQLEPDGNDETPASEIELPARGRFEKIGRHWAALQRVCDLAVLGDALYLAHATRPLGLGGASITRYQPDAKPPFSLSFNWNREGEPEQGGAGGQGFLRVRAIEGRLYVPDADPPYLGLGLATGIEGYLFASDAQGKLAGARMPRHLPPRAPSADRPGAIILPGSLHGFDVIRFRGKLYASTSAAIPPNGSARSSPGTLFTPGDKAGPWQVALTYVGSPPEPSVRLGYMTRFRDRLYVALSPLYGAARHDFLIITPARDATVLTDAEVRAVQVTPSGGAHTLRWYADQGKLYWIAIASDGVTLRVTTDGEHFHPLRLPADAGYPSDVLRVGSRLVVLAERGLYAQRGEAFELIAPIADDKTPFKVDDGYCAAPLSVFQGSLYAGDQLRGNLWKLVTTAE